RARSSSSFLRVSFSFWTTFIAAEKACLASSSARSRISSRVCRRYCGTACELISSWQAKKPAVTAPQVAGGHAVNRIFFVMGLGALELSCGSDPIRVQPPGSQCPLVSGEFDAYTTLVSSTGTCGSIPKRPYAQLQFKNGEMQSPLGSLLSCGTIQTDCDVTIV